METLANRPQISPNLPPQPPTERTPRVPKRGLPPPEFKVGDFVWAKIKTHLWWPARVVVPKAGSYLVSLFLAGRGFHCRESSQLKPFGEEFEPMSKQTSTKSFAVAVSVAADELAKEAFSDFAPEEFLRRVKGAACDVSVCDFLVATRLKCWVLSFVRENGMVVGSLSELVDVEPIPEGPEIRDGLPSPRRKRKSMAEIISVAPDVVSSGKPREKGVDLPSVEVGGAVAEEGIGSPRRERKKSKYLSPPYTFGRGYKRSDWFKEDEEEEEEEEEEEVDNGAVGQKEEGKVSALRKYAGISSNVILSQLLLTAADPLFRISNRPDKAIWSFFTEFRSSPCSRDAEFEDYVKGLVGSGGFKNKIVRSEVVGEAKFAADNNVVKVGGNEKASLSVGSEPRKRGRPKKDRSFGEVSMNLGHHIESRKREDGVSMVGKSRLASGGASRDVCHNTSGLTELAKSGQKRKSKSGEEGANGGIQRPNSTGGNSNESEGRAPRQIRKKKEVNVVAPLVEEPKHPFVYVRENLETMISTLAGTSSGIVLAGGLKLELKETLVSEIQGTLNKVNSLQTEIARYS